MGKAQSSHAFGRKGASAVFGETQAPLVQDVRRQKSAARGPTSYLEAYWPFYAGIGLPGLLAGFIITGLVMAGAIRPVIGVITLLFGIPFAFLGFLLVSVILTRILSSIRGGAETIGNLIFLTHSNAGFKIGALIGLGAFLTYSSDNFVDPFTGQESYKSAIVAIFLLKVIGAMGFFGMILSRLENFFRRRFWSNLPEDKRGQVEDVLGPALKIRPTSRLPQRVERLLQTWQGRAATIICVLAFSGRVLSIARSGQMPDPGSLIRTGLFCLLAYVILRFYFKIVDRLLRTMSGLYGFSISVRQTAA